MKTMPYSMLLLAVAAGLVVTAGVGCQEDTKPSTEPAATPIAPAAETPGVATSSNVAKIVFVGQKEACPCTRKRVDQTWKTLQSVLANGPKIPVEKIQLDVDEKRYDELDDMESLVVAPGIYFFDVDDRILKLLQGESSAEQIESVIRK